jgi:hypothetical protein
MDYRMMYETDYGVYRPIELFCENPCSNCESAFDPRTARGYTLLAHTPVILFRAEETMEEDYGGRTRLST